MPQMSPLLWLNLSIFFITTLMLFMILNFFIKIPSKAPYADHKKHQNVMNWKW
uniref:ATP synthase complex subunit 8 n=1 Tax=Leptalpheus forceps TaxID=576216 RepID=A0A6B9PPG6_9EUCA|nr:ATP synthase F0 subunit 8 [Leptalpheus forceps]